MRSASSSRALLPMFVSVLGLACASAEVPPPPPLTIAPQPRASAPTRPPETIQSRVLPSGMRVILDADASSRLAIVASAVLAGARNDPPGKRGLAHLVEHLTYRSVAAAGATPLWQRLTQLPLAMPVHGQTGWDQMTFRSVAPAARWRELLAVEAGRLAGPLAGVDQRAVSLESRITEDQAHMADDTGEASGWGDVLADDLGDDDLAPGNSRGTDGSRRTLTLDDARAFVRARFRPDAMTLVVAGNVGGATLDEVVARLPRALVEAPPEARPPLEAGPPPHALRAPPSAAPGQPAAITVVPVPALMRPTLYLSWPLPSLWSNDNASVRWVTRLVSEQLGVTSLRRRERDVVSVNVGRFDTLERALLVVEVCLRDATGADAVRRLVTDRVNAFAREPDAARWTFDRVRDHTLTQLRLGSPPDGRALNEAIVSNAFRTIVSSTHDVAAFAMEPWERIAALAMARLGGAPHAVLRTPSTSPALARAEPTALETAADDRVAAAASWDPASLRALVEPVGASKVLGATLFNGTTLIYLRRPGARTAAWLGYRGGTSSGANEALVRWAQGHRLDITDRATSLDMLTTSEIDADTTFDTVSFRPEQLELALTALVARARGGVATWPTPTDFELALAASPSDLPEERAHRTFWRNLYGTHPYGHVYSLADAHKVTRAEAGRWVDSVVRPTNAALVVVGDLDFQELLAAANRAVASWLPRDGESPAPPPSAPKTRASGARPRTAVIDRPGRRMIDVRLGCLIPNANVKDRGRRLVLRRAVEERLFNDLRHATGATQGVSVDIRDLRGSADLAIWVGVDSDRLAPVLATLHGIWSRWSTTGFDAGETNLGIWRAIGGYAAQFETEHQVARMLFNEWNQDQPLDDVDKLPGAILALTPADLTATFASCRANASMTLVGRSALIEPALKASWPDLERAP